MTRYAKVRTEAVIFLPNNISDNNAVFVNSAGSVLSVKDNDGITSKISTDTATSYTIKQMQSSAIIRAGKPVSKRSDGKIQEAESDGVGGQQPVGVALSPFAASNDLGTVLLFGPNAAGVLTGLGFAPGDEIFIGETTGGYVNDITPFTGNNDSIIRIGVADCAAGTASSSATDLILISTIISRP